MKKPILGLTLGNMAVAGAVVVDPTVTTISLTFIWAVLLFVIGAHFFYLNLNDALADSVTDSTGLMRLNFYTPHAALTTVGVALISFLLWDIGLWGLLMVLFSVVQLAGVGLNWYLEVKVYDVK